MPLLRLRHASYSLQLSLNYNGTRFESCVIIQNVDSCQKMQHTRFPINAEGVPPLHPFQKPRRSIRDCSSATERPRCTEIWARVHQNLHLTRNTYKSLVGTAIRGPLFGMPKIGRNYNIKTKL